MWIVQEEEVLSSDENKVARVVGNTDDDQRIWGREIHWTSHRSIFRADRSTKFGTLQLLLISFDIR